MAHGGDAARIASATGIHEGNVMKNVDLHLTLLFGWLVRTVGQALMWSMWCCS